MFDIEKAGILAQKISFAFEDNYHDEDKQRLFLALFDRYLAPVDPTGRLDVYDAIILLARKEPAEFGHMINEMKDKELISE